MIHDHKSHHMDIWKVRRQPTLEQVLEVLMDRRLSNHLPSHAVVDTLRQLYMDRICYKLTDQMMRTYSQTQWKLGVPLHSSGNGGLCSSGWLHFYDDPLLAVFLNPIHAPIVKPRLFVAQWNGMRLDDHGLKAGSTELTLLKEIPVPAVSRGQRIAFGILCALSAIPPGRSERWRDWAERWLSGEDRTADAAYATCRATYAAANAANAAAYAATCRAACRATYAYTAANAANAAAYAAAYAATTIDLPLIAAWAVTLGKSLKSL
jgi:hypothetical protein